MGSDIPDLTFNSKGECDYCRLHDKWEREYPLNPNGTRRLAKIVEKIKRDGEGKRYDCVTGISGGRDSSYLLYVTKEKLGLRPLAVHWDNGWNTEIAEHNIQRMVDGLNVDFFRMRVKKEEYDDICKSFLLASVPDADIPNDIALTVALYYVAERFRVKHVLIGHSFRTESTVPLGWSYMDGKYVKSLQQEFGSCPIETFPNLWLSKWLRWMLVERIKRVRPFWYLNYQQKEAMNFLRDKFGWTWYGGKHLENKYTLFVSNYLQPRKFNIDLRLIRFSALVRSGQMTRQEALEKIAEPPETDPAIIEEVKERLGFTDEQFEEMMNAPKKTHHDYDTYHSTFKRWRLLFWLASKLSLVPKTFYEKYTR